MALPAPLHVDCAVVICLQVVPSATCGRAFDGTVAHHREPPTKDWVRVRNSVLEALACVHARLLYLIPCMCQVSSYLFGTSPALPAAWIEMRLKAVSAILTDPRSLLIPPCGPRADSHAQLVPHASYPHAPSQTVRSPRALSSGPPAGGAPRVGPSGELPQPGSQPSIEQIQTPSMA